MPVAAPPTPFLARFCLGVALGAAAFSGPALAQSYMEEIEEQRDTSTWEAPFKEGEVAFPPFPEEGALRPLDSEAVGSGYEYYLDPASVSLAADRVSRYTVVIESASGARNVYYEGIRCATNEVRTYAYGTPQGTFRPVAQTTWKPLFTSGPLAYRNLLAERYVCDANGWALPAKEVLERLEPRGPGVAARPKPQTDSN